MLDFGFPELLVIVALTVLVIGPKELPVVMRTLGRVVKRFQYVRYSITQQFDDFMRADDLEELRRSVNMEVRSEDQDLDGAAEDDELTAIEAGDADE